jgi:hypothetical protein
MIYTTAQIKDGTGFDPDTRFISITAEELADVREWYAEGMHRLDALFTEANETCNYGDADTASFDFNEEASGYLAAILGLEA